MDCARIDTHINIKEWFLNIDIKYRVDGDDSHADQKPLWIYYLAQFLKDN